MEGIIWTLQRQGQKKKKKVKNLDDMHSTIKSQMLMTGFGYADLDLGY